MAEGTKPPSVFSGPALPARLELQQGEHCVLPCSRCPLQSLVRMEKRQAGFHVAFLHPHRGIPDSLCGVLHLLRNPRLLPGNGSGAVHK